MQPIPRIAVFASGNGSNAQRLADYFSGTGILEIAVIYCNNPDAYVLKRAEILGIPTVEFNRSTFYNTTAILDDMKNRGIDWIILAGFLWLIPDYIIHEYPGRIVNIHPALLPLYGGKGMYGMRVHQAVVAAADPESGISIHYVNEHYDEGDIIFQARCKVNSSDTAETLAAKIHELEYEHFPRVLRNLIAGAKKS